MRRAITLVTSSLVALVALSPENALAADYFVASTGDDGSAGAAASPFLTIGKCAAVGVAGDTCHVAAGHYRERVKPPHGGTSGKPLTFVADGGVDTVFVTGREPLTSFSAYKPSIWKASTSAKPDALFVDGARMIVARWPNLAGGDEYRPTFYETGTDGGTSWIIDTTHLTQGAGYWSGAKLFVVAGLGWAADEVTVSKWDPTTHRIDFTPEVSFASSTYTATKETRYYLYDQLQLLDAPGEWFFDASAGVVYLGTPDGKDPSTHDVEMATMVAGFDLSGLSDVTIHGFDVESGTIDMTNATDCRLEESRVVFGPVVAGGSFGSGGQIVVGGSGNVIDHCEVAYAPGRCVYLGGTGNTLQSSHVHHCDAVGTYEQIVEIAGKQNVVSDCRLHDTGRDGVGTSTAPDGSIFEHDEIASTCLIAKDCGGFYTYMTSGNGVVVRWSVVHDVHPAKTEAYGGISLGNGIYFDDGCSNWSAHHNVVYDVGYYGMFLHQPSTQMHVFNNTIVGSGGGTGSLLATAPGNGGPDATGSILENNLTAMLDGRASYCVDISGATPTYDHDGYFDASGKGHTNNVAVESTAVVGDPKFVDATKDDYALLPASPMIDKGVAIAGVTDGYAGKAPDIGAFENGGTETPGPRGVVGPTVTAPANDGGVEAGTDGGIGDAALDSALASDGGAVEDAASEDAGEAGTGEGGSASSSGCGCRMEDSGAAPAGWMSVAMVGFVAGLWAKRRR